MVFSYENYVSRDLEYTEKNEIWIFRGKNRSLLNARYWEYTDELRNDSSKKQKT